jgi:S-adenosylmethionine:tRNA ribosyltransferase-isomerase
LITNFHQPGSTLVLLIATIMGENWRKVYQEALAQNYRFLSYGDSSLLWINQSPE